jgi:hypothetical protein
MDNYRYVTYFFLDFVRVFSIDHLEAKQRSSHFMIIPQQGV